ncbi:MAG TPA: hypothetical protein PLI27_00045 [Ignavibacteriales bacterium]|nr:hypothetical protein [Ignavibacteriales bacterium]HPD66455.1 hypothetical protein [Ignavibacteriales bacterium]HRR19236.1 hypothetical protein [Ignavibacteriales bacterium]
MKATKIFAAFLLFLFLTSVNYAQKAPANLRAAILVKVLAFEKGYKPNGSILVIGDNELAAQLEASGKFSKVDKGSGAPSGSYNAVYCDDAGLVGAVTSYTRSKKVPSLTGVLNLVEKGITVGIGIDGGKPKILMNLSSSQAEGLDWNPAIFNIVTKI